MVSLSVGKFAIATFRISTVNTKHITGVTIWHMLVQGCLYWIFKFFMNSAFICFDCFFPSPYIRLLIYYISLYHHYPLIKIISLNASFLSSGTTVSRSLHSLPWCWGTATLLSSHTHFPNQETGFGRVSLSQNTRTHHSSHFSCSLLLPHSPLSVWQPCLRCSVFFIFWLVH